MERNGKLKLDHLNYTVGIDKVTLPFPWKRVYWLHIHNTSSNTLYISFDQGETWKTISADRTLGIKGFSDKPIEIKKDAIRVYGSGLNTTIEILVLVD